MKRKGRISSTDKVINLVEKRQEMQDKVNNLIDEIEKEFKEYDDKFGKDFTPKNFEEASADVNALFSLAGKVDELTKATAKLHGKRVTEDDLMPFALDNRKA